MKSDAETKTLFCFGLGFAGTELARKLCAEGWRVAGTRRREDSLLEKEAEISVFEFDGTQASDSLTREIQKASHVLVTIPPDPEKGDVVLSHFNELWVRHPSLRWLGYLSTTGVYGHREGEWVDETSELMPKWDHQKRRAAAEQQWLDLYRQHRLPVHVFRLAGIYGPGRNLLERVKQGTARRIDVPGLVFNRVHVADVARVLTASIASPDPGSVYNVSDDDPSSPAEAVAFACELLQVETPPLISLEEAGLSEMGRGFYATSKKVRNRKIKEELGIELLYPDYRTGLRSLMDEEKKP